WTSTRNVSSLYGLPQQAGKAIVPSKNFGKIRGYCNLQYMYIIAQSRRGEHGKNRAEVVVSEAAWDRVLLQVPNRESEPCRSRLWQQQGKQAEVRAAGTDLRLVHRGL